MQTIIVERVVHRDEPRLLLKFREDQALINLVRSIPDCLWTKTYGAWHVPDSALSHTEPVRLNGKGVDIHQGDSKPLAHKAITKMDTPNPYVIDELASFGRYLAQRRYSDNTIRTYTEGLKVFLQFTGKSVLEITHNDLERFNHDYVVRHNYSFSFQNQVINAVKLFFRSIHSINFSVDAIERPRREHKELIQNNIYIFGAIE